MMVSASAVVSRLSLAPVRSSKWWSVSLLSSCHRTNRNSKQLCSHKNKNNYNNYCSVATAAPATGLPSTLARRRRRQRAPPPSALRSDHHRRHGSSSSSSSSLTDWMGDAWRQKTPSPVNPLVSILRKDNHGSMTVTQSDHHASQTTATPSTFVLRHAQPHHVQEAVAELPLWQSDRSTALDDTPTSTVTTTTTTTDARLLRHWHSIVAAHWTLRQWATLCRLLLLSSSSSLQEEETTALAWDDALKRHMPHDPTTEWWRHSATLPSVSVPNSSTATDSDDTADATNAQCLYEELRQRLEDDNDDNNSSECSTDNESTRAMMRRLVREYEDRWQQKSTTTTTLENETSDDTTTTTTTYSMAQMTDALDAAYADVWTIASGGTPTARTIGILYQCLGWSRRVRPAAALTKKTSVDQDEVTTLLADVAHRIRLDHVVSRDEQELAAFLAPSGDVVTNAATHWDEGSLSAQQSRWYDERTMLRLEQHVTLDGALEFGHRTAQDLFDVTVERDESLSSTDHWHESVQLYHVYDNNSNHRSSDNDATAQHTRTLLGSFYVDPVRRRGKEERTFTLPLVPRTHDSVPIVAMSLNIRTPTWDDDPITVNWEECEAVLHEYGHVLQFLLANTQSSPFGAWTGPQHTPLAVSEVLPQFMEHWLWEESTVYALVHLSRSHNDEDDDANHQPVAEEEIQAAFRVRSRDKAESLLQDTFMSTLERTILHDDYDLQGGTSETIMAVQDRLAEAMVPHNLPDKDDVTPLLEIVRDHARGRYGVWYRYVYGDALAAEAFQRVKAAYNDCNHQHNSNSSTDDTRNDTDGSSRSNNQEEQQRRLVQVKRALRQLLLEPGADVDMTAVRKALGMRPRLTAEALCERYGL